MPFLVKNNKILDPIKICFYGAFTIATYHHILVYGLQKWGFGWRQDDDSFRDKIFQYVIKLWVKCKANNKLVATVIYSIKPIKNRIKQNQKDNESYFCNDKKQLPLANNY